ncbi:hypothetical protein B4133_2628 [Bacillus altitudinis]|nr:hypothetical protein B4133_2628 [Bacillus altitudinis]
MKHTAPSKVTVCCKISLENIPLFSYFRLIYARIHFSSIIRRGGSS